MNNVGVKSSLVGVVNWRVHHFLYTCLQTTHSSRSTIGAVLPEFPDIKNMIIPASIEMSKVRAQFILTAYSAYFNIYSDPSFIVGVRFKDRTR